MVVATFRWQPGKAATVTQTELLLLMICYCFLACILKSCEIFFSKQNEKNPLGGQIFSKKKKKTEKLNPRANHK